MPSDDSILRPLVAALGEVPGRAVADWAAVNRRSVEVDHSLHGHSTAGVAIVHVQQDDRAPERRIVAKTFGTESARDNEASRHRAALADAPEFAEHHLVCLAFDSIVCPDGSVVMFQELAAGGLRDHAPVQKSIGTPSAATACGMICESLLEKWNSTGTRPQSLSLAEMMSRHLGVRIEPGGKIAAWARDVPALLSSPAAWLEITGDTLPNPFAFALAPRLSGSAMLRVQHGKVHGDLHVNNVVCTPPEDEPFGFRLVDLASYSVDLPLAWDQASLLMSVVRYWLDELPDPEQARRLLFFLAGETGPGGLPSGLVDAIAAIRKTGDRWAERRGRLIDWRAQFQAAEVSSALILTGRSTLTPEQRWWFFQLAARLLKALLAKLGVLEPGTPVTIGADEIAKLPPKSAEEDVPRARASTGATPPSLTEPRSAWRQRQQFENTRSHLRLAEPGDEFARVARAMLSVAFGGLGGGVRTTASETVPGLFLAHKGNPHGEPLLIAVQFADLGAGEDWFTSHAEDSVRLIRRFQQSGQRADHYLFVHNRDHRDQRYNAAVAEALRPLSSLGDVAWTTLWDYRDLARHVWQAVSDQCDLVISEYSARAAEVLSGLTHHDPVTEVPFRRYRATFSNRGLERIGEPSEGVADPVPGLVEATRGIQLVVGEFGYGKTTLAVRASKATSRRVLLLPAARLTSEKMHLAEVMSAVLQREGRTGGGWTGMVGQLWDEISPQCLKIRLKTPGEDLLLIVDGLDEAPLVQRRSGLLDLLRTFRKIDVPVLVSVRTEFWNSRLDEVRAAISATTNTVQHIATTELRPWTAAGMLVLVDRSLALDGPDAGLEDFRRLLENDGYGKLYGDIPRRPLFLAMLIEDIREEGLRERSRLDLMTDWLHRKVERDWALPKITGDATRPPIRTGRTETLDRTKNRAFQLMAAAARAMIAVEPTGELTLLPVVPIDDVLDGGPGWFADVDPEALAVQSVLLPAGERGPGGVQLFRFAHHAFQEYFLAHSLRREPDPVLEAAAPEEVREWLRAMRSAFPG
ncbi:hypothetical protein [Lentzea sp. NPDC060358]|uniref:hypothetical protein n=1 Tax=Lentzea sp. NPDC060358 TaxID=3347103 RepID=UPI003651E7DA